MAKLPAIPARLSKIDGLLLEEHPHLRERDDCYFLWEWDGRPYAHSATTDFIGNLQRETRFRDRYWPWRYKQEAIAHAAVALKRAVPAPWRERSVFVPVPPSKIRGDPRHDSRLLDILRAITDPKLNDVRDLFIQTRNLESRQKNISPADRLSNWTLDLNLIEPIPAHFVIVDDLVSGGSHFAAMRMGLELRFPGIPVSGIFLARRVLP